MRPTLYNVDHHGPGRLSIMAKPRGDDWLEDEMAALRSVGVDVLVSALTPIETSEFGLAEESQAALRAGLQFVSSPIQDRDLPDTTVVTPTLQRLATQFQAGAHIVTHCRFGIGRASLLAAAILVLNGVTPDEAWNQIERARGQAVPDTAAQRQWPANLLKQA